MGENKAVHAPYNFIPFAENPWLPYSSIDELPPHDRIDPKRRTGELHITLTAETPVFVAGEKGGQPGGTSHFFRTPDGAFAIPGSTIRGMTRANMQILSFAPMRLGEDIGNCHPLYREVASASKSTAGALKAYYHNALGVTARRSASGKACTVPENVRAGYIRCEKNGYAIYPTKGGKYFRVPRSASPEGEGYAKTSIVFYSTNGERVEEVRTTCWTDSALKGTLLYTGKAALKPNPLYLFPEEDVDGLPVPVPQEDVLSYKADWEKRKNGLRPASFWKLPEPGELAKPVFYIRHEGHVYFGMSLFLRIGYKHAIADGLPPKHNAISGQADGPLDYPSGILGFSRDKLAYRSRVSFGDFAAEAGAREGAPVCMILGEPKPGYYPGYLRPVPPQTGVKHYNDDDFRLRGFKQYWLKKVQATNVPQGKEKVGTALCPLPEGTRFHGVVRYKNLSDAELGLLLWSLCLDEGCWQNVGMGKPYGYGRMSVRVERMVEFAPGDLYSGALCPASSQKTGGELKRTVQGCISAYEAEATATLGGEQKRPLREMPAIRDFFYMKRAVQEGEAFNYMQLSEYQNPYAPLPLLWEIRHEQEKRQQADKTPVTMEEQLAQLQQRYGKQPQQRRKR